MSTVAFIGLGAMGSRMAMNLHAAGHKLRVFNRDRAKSKTVRRQGHRGLRFARRGGEGRGIRRARSCRTTSRRAK